MLSLMVSNSSVPATTSTLGDTSTIILFETPAQAKVATELQVSLASRPPFQNFHVASIESFSQLVHTYDQCISLLELYGPIMGHLTEQQFTTIKHMTQSSKRILWVSGIEREIIIRPEASMINGFGKTLMLEQPNLVFTCLGVSLKFDIVGKIARVLDYNRTATQDEIETELLERDGIFDIPRVVEAPHINELNRLEDGGSAPEPVDTNGAVGSDLGPLELCFSFGRLDSLHFRPDNTASLPLQDDEVRVHVKATGINFKDVVVALNEVLDDHIGQEFAGIVVDSGASAHFHPGDRVCGIAGGSFRTHLRAKKSHIMRIPPGLDFTEACSVPVAFATAQYGLCHLAQLKAGETILIHAAAGAVGQAAIQIAQRIGAVVLVTVSSQAKKEFLMTRYGIDASSFFSSRHVSFRAQIMKKTAGRGVDVVLNSLSGRALTESWRSLATLGRFVEIGKRDISSFKSLPMEPFLRNVSFCSLDLAVIGRESHSLMEQLMREVERDVLSEATRLYSVPSPLTVFKRSGFEDSFRFLQTGEHYGKAVVDWEQQDTIQVCTRGYRTVYIMTLRLIDFKVVRKSRLDNVFESNATYVIAGGLGGIGRNVAEWMFHQGARHLILLSRSGIKSSSTAEKFAAKLKEKGVSIYAPQCDISDPEAVEAVMRYAESNMPPIRGCIQAAMVIKVSGSTQLDQV